MMNQCLDLFLEEKKILLDGSKSCSEKKMSLTLKKSMVQERILKMRNLVRILWSSGCWIPVQAYVDKARVKGECPCKSSINIADGNIITPRDIGTRTIFDA